MVNLFMAHKARKYIKKAAAHKGEPVSHGRNIAVVIYEGGRKVCELGKTVFVEYSDVSLSPFDHIRIANSLVSDRYGEMRKQAKADWKASRRTLIGGL